MANLLNIDYSTAVNGTAYDVTSYLRTPHGSDAADPDNHYVVLTDVVEVSGGVLTAKDGDDNNWSLAGVHFGSFGTLGSPADGWWDATRACVSIDMTFTTGALDDVSVGTLFLLHKNELQPSSYPIELLLRELSGNQWGLELNAQGFGGLIEDDSNIFDRVDLENIRTRIRIEWKAGTPTLSSPGFSAVASDGFIRVYWNGVLIINLTNLDLYLSDDQDGPNWANGVSLGHNGLMGEIHTFRVNDSLCSTRNYLITGENHHFKGDNIVMHGANGTLDADNTVHLNLDGVPRTRQISGALDLWGRFFHNGVEQTGASIEVSAASRLLGRGSAGGAGPVEEITLGTGLSMSGATLSSSGGTGILDSEFVRKTSDESLNNSATLQADNELTFPVAASEEWEFEFNVVYLGNTTGDFRCGLKFPTSPTEISYFIDGIISSLANDGGSGVSGDRGITHAIADAVSGAILGAGTNKSVARLHGFVRNGSNAGSVTLWWAQGTSDGTNTTVKAGSWVRAFRVA